MKIGDILFEFKAKHPVGEYPEVLTLTERNGFVSQSERFNKRLATEDVSNYKFIGRDDFAFNPYLLWAGALARNDRFNAGVISPLYPTFRVKPGFDPAYVIRILLADSSIKRYDSIAFGSVPRRRRSSVQDFLGLDIPSLPSLDEQRRIAGILDKADALRAKRREAIDHLNTLSQSIFHEVFGDPGAASRVTLSEVLRSGLRNGLSPSTSGAVTGDVLTLSAITGSELDLSQKKAGLFDSEFHAAQLVRSGQILICRGNGSKALVGKGKIVREDLAEVGYPDTIIAGDINTAIVEPVFLQSVWDSIDVRGQIERGARTTNGTFKVNQALLGSVSFPLPEMERQQEFAGRVSAVERLKATHRAQLAELDNLFLSLQDRAFKGHL